MAGSRHRKRKSGSERPYKISGNTLDKLLDSTQNNKRNKPFAEQIEAHTLPYRRDTGGGPKPVAYCTFECNPERDEPIDISLLHNLYNQFVKITQNVKIGFK